MSVTALGSQAGPAAAATAVIAYLEGRQPARAGANPAVHPEPEAGTGVGAYYADSVEGPGVWLGHGVGPASMSGLVDPVGLERVLLGRHPTTGEQVHHLTQHPSAHAVRPAGDVLTATQAGALLGVSGRYVRRRATTTDTDNPGCLRGQKDDGPTAAWRFERAEVERFAAHRHRPAVTVGFDVTFSAPKSVSVLWAIAGPAQQREILASMEASVRAGIDYLERNAIAYRVAGTVQPGGGLLGAGYLHATNRNLDPQLHWHVVVANMTDTGGGKVRALDGRQLFVHAKTAGYLASVELRHQLSSRLGVAWTVDQRGVAEIVGVPPAVIEAASSRAREIDQHTASLGLDGPAARQVAAYQTRTAKPAPVDPATLRDQWTTVFAALGFGAEHVARTVVDRSKVLRDLDPGVVEAWYRRLSSPKGVTEQSAVFDRRDVIQHLASQAGPATTARVIERLADIWLASNAVVRLHDRLDRERGGIVRSDGRAVRTPTGLGLFTTPEMLAAERRVLDTVTHGLGHGVAVVEPATLAAAVAGHEKSTRGRLGDDQRAMVEAICTSGDRVQCVIGPAGSGKTYALTAAARAWHTTGHTVWGAAVNGTAAEHLQAATHIPSGTLASLLTRLDHATRPILGPTHVIVVDEASTIGTRQLDRLLAHTTAAGAAVRLIGDPAQHSSVEAGGIFRALCEHHPERTPQLSVLRRQHGPDMADVRAVLTDYRSGHIVDAVHQLHHHGRVTVADQADRLVDRIVGDWYGDRQQRLARPELAGSSMIAEHHSTRRVLNDQARALLRADGTLTGPDLVVGGQRFAVGDEIIARAPAHHLHPDGNRADYVRNGTRGVITNIDPDRAAVTVDFERRGVITVGHHDLTRPLRPGIDGIITHAYALTSHAAQGHTMTAGRILAGPTATPAGIYVGLSRGAADAHLYQLTTPPRDGQPDDRLPTLPAPAFDPDAFSYRLEHTAPERLAQEHDPIGLGR